MDILIWSSDFLTLGLFNTTARLLDFLLGAFINVIIVLIALILSLLILMPITLLQWLLQELGLYQPLSALVYGYDFNMESETIGDGDISLVDLGMANLTYLTFSGNEIQIINYAINSLSIVIVFILVAYIITLLFTVSKATFSATAKNEFWKSLITTLVIIALVVNIGYVYGMLFDINEFFVTILRNQEINIATFVMNIDFTTWNQLANNVAISPEDIGEDNVFLDPLEFLFLVIAFSLMQLFFFGLTAYFNYFYFMRKIALMILMIIGPIIVTGSLFYQFRSLAMNWFKALTGNIFIQAIHALVFFLMFTILIGLLDEDSGSFTSAIVSDEAGVQTQVLDENQITETLDEDGGLFAKQEDLPDHCSEEESEFDRECFPGLETNIGNSDGETSGIFDYMVDGFLMILIMFLVIPMTNVLKGLFSIDTYTSDGLAKGGGLGLTAISSLYNNARASAQDQSWARTARNMIGQGDGRGDVRNPDDMEMSNAQKNINRAQQFGRQAGRFALGSAGTFVGAGAGGVTGTAIGSAVGSEVGAKLGNTTGGLIAGTKEVIGNNRLKDKMRGKQNSRLDVDEEIDKNTNSKVNSNNMSTAVDDSRDFTDKLNNDNNMKDIADRTGQNLAQSHINNPDTKEAFMKELDDDPNTANMSDEDKEMLWEEHKKDIESNFKNRSNSAYSDLKREKGSNADISENDLAKKIKEKEYANGNTHFSDSDINNAVATAKTESAQAFSDSLQNRMEHASDISDIANKTANDLTVEEINNPKTKEEFMKSLDGNNMSQREKEQAWDDQKVAIADKNKRDTMTAMHNIKDRKGQHANITPQEFAEELADVKIANQASEIYDDMDQVDEYVSASKIPNSDAYNENFKQRGQIESSVKGATEKSDAEYRAKYNSGERKASEMIADSVVSYKHHLNKNRGQIAQVYKTDNPTATDEEIETMVDRDINNKVGNFAESLNSNMHDLTDGNPNQMIDKSIQGDYVKSSLKQMKNSGVAFNEQDNVASGVINDAGKGRFVTSNNSSGASYQQLASQMTAQQVANNEISPSDYGTQYQNNLNDIVTNKNNSGHNFAYNGQTNGWANGLSSVSSDVESNVRNDLTDFVMSDQFKNDFMAREDVKHLPKNEQDQKFQDKQRSILQKADNISDSIMQNNSQPANMQMAKTLTAESLANKYAISSSQAESLVDSMQKQPSYNYASMQDLSKNIMSGMKNGGSVNPDQIAKGYVDKYIDDNDIKTNFMKQPEISSLGRAEKQSAWNSHKQELQSSLVGTTEQLAGNISKGVGDKNISQLSQADMNTAINSSVDQLVQDNLRDTHGISSDMSGFMKDYVKYPENNVSDIQSNYASNSSLPNVQSSNMGGGSSSMFGSIKQKIGGLRNQTGLTAEQAKFKSDNNMIYRQMFSFAGDSDQAQENAAKINQQYHGDLRNYSSNTIDTLEPSQINDLVKRESYTDQMTGQEQQYIPRGAIRFVEKDNESYVEVMDDNNMYHKVSNIGSGNPKLNSGETMYRDMEIKDNGLGVINGDKGRYYQIDSTNNQRKYVDSYQSNTSPHELIATRNSSYNRSTAHAPLNNNVMSGDITLKDIKDQSKDGRIYTFVTNKGTHHAIKDADDEYKSISKVFNQGNRSLRTGETIVQTHEIQGYNIVSDPNEFNDNSEPNIVINKNNGEKQNISNLELDQEIQPKNVFTKLNRLND